MRYRVFNNNFAYFDALKAFIVSLWYRQKRFSREIYEASLLHFLHFNENTYSLVS